MTYPKIISVCSSEFGGIPKYPQEIVQVRKYGIKGDFHSGETNKHAKKISVALRKFERVIVDYRIPDQIRIAISPLAMTYDEVYRGMKRIRESVIRKDYIKVDDNVSEVT